MFEMRYLWINEEPGRGRKGWPLCLLRKLGDAERPSDSRRTAEHVPGEIDKARELGGTAGEDYPSARLGRKGGCGEPVANHFENFFHPRFDDAHQLRPRHELRRSMIVLLERRDRDHIAFV